VEGSFPWRAVSLDSEKVIPSPIRYVFLPIDMITDTEKERMDLVRTCSEEENDNRTHLK
jgi:hypothetical protein